jgi:hypothetical protein
MTGRDVLVYSDHGELMETLLEQRGNFATDEEFRDYAVSAVRRFIADLRTIGIEASLRANYLDRPPSFESPATKLGH